MTKFMSAQKAAKLPGCPVTEHYIRKLIKLGKCPGYQNGRYFFVNTDALFTMIAQKSVSAERAELAV